VEGIFEFAVSAHLVILDNVPAIRAFPGFGVNH